jgi:hypothetical protein
VKHLNVNHKYVTLALLLSHDTGPRLTSYDIARISLETDNPISDETVRRDCDRGALVVAVMVPRGTLWEGRIAFADAKRYLQIRCAVRDVPRETTPQSPQSPTTHR